MVQRFLPIRLLLLLTAPSLMAVGLAHSTAAHALYEGLQCVPYARQLSGVQIYGDAHTWWGQAQGKYARGHVPKIGAVLAFKPHGKMQLGHVAAVSQILDDRTLLISHANWSTINGVRGHIENNVKVVDVSPRNDWSRVRVWYTPIAALGTTEWPTHGFIYPDKAPKSMPPAGAPIQYAAKPAPKSVPKSPPALQGKAPEPKKLAANVALAPPPASARVQTPVQTPAKAHYAPAPQPASSRPLRDYNARPQTYGQNQSHAQRPAPRQPEYQARYQPAPAPRAQHPLPRGYTPSVAAPGVSVKGAQNMDDLLKGL